MSDFHDVAFMILTTSFRCFYYIDSLPLLFSVMNWMNLNLLVGWTSLPWSSSSINANIHECAHSIARQINVISILKLTRSIHHVQRKLNLSSYKLSLVLFFWQLFPFKTPIRYETPVIKLHTVTDSIGFGTRTLALLGLNFWILVAPTSVKCDTLKMALCCH